MGGAGLRLLHSTVYFSVSSYIFFCFILYGIIKNVCNAYKSISHLLNQPEKKTNRG